MAGAEDITQEVFNSLSHKLGSFRGESAFKTRLHRLTVNRVLMHFRRVKSRRDGLTEGVPEPPRTLSPETSLIVPQENLL